MNEQFFHSFTGKLDTYIPELTQDGSWTLRGKDCNEGFHSLSGAQSETRFHYIQGCQLERFKSGSDARILEVGFGLGVGLDEALALWKQERFKGRLHFVSLEIDPALVDFYEKRNQWGIEFQRKSFQDASYAFYEDGPLSLTIWQGPGVETLSTIKENYHTFFNAIFQDPFSPKKNPSLWTKEWFSLLREVSASDCILSTYSASVSIRENLQVSGWPWYEGGPFGKKRSSTRARPLQ